MTYNFDPDRWYANEMAYLEDQRRRGKLDRDRFEKACIDLDRRYEEMCQRLDGTYRLS
jgi:hypothetical protein